jgi:hypothetical protein
MRKAVISTIVLAGIAPLFILGTALQANAATSCYASSCTGLVAANTTCVNDAEVVSRANIYDVTNTVVIDGYVQLKYSPSCRAAWARVISNNGDTSQAIVERTGSPVSGEEGCTGHGGAGTGCNTDMLNDAGVTSTAIGNIILPSGYIEEAKTGSY